MVNLFYNYYIPSDEVRKDEVDYCFIQNVIDPNIDNIFVLVTKEHFDEMFKLIDEEYQYKVNTIIDDRRPTFKYVVYGCLGENCSPNDINIFLNSDCFIGDETDWDFVRNMSSNDRFSLSRFDIQSINPLVMATGTGFPRVDSQDCWIFKGKPNEGMNIDFHFGMPGCDNRMSYEFGVDGYNVTGPISKIKVLHYHPSAIRSYDADRDRVNGHYRLVYFS